MIQIKMLRMTNDLYRIEIPYCIGILSLGICELLDTILGDCAINCDADRK